MYRCRAAKLVVVVLLEAVGHAAWKMTFAERPDLLFQSSLASQAIVVFVSRHRGPCAIYD